MKKIAIIGAGISGLFFANLLEQNKSISYKIFERKNSIDLNDGYGKRDDGLMVGTVHQLSTIELLYYISKSNYDGPIYFDTFPSVMVIFRSAIAANSSLWVTITKVCPYAVLSSKNN